MSELKKEKTVQTKMIKIRNSNLVQKELKTTYSKFQLLMAKIFKLNLLDSYQYLYKIDYLGNVRLKPNDIVVNSQGVVFVVLKESNRLAMLVSQKAFAEKPKMYGSLTLLIE